MSNGGLSKAVLGSLVLKPSLIESSELLTADLFLSPRERRTFEIICEAYEDLHPAEVDAILLASKLGGGDAASFVGSLTDGLQSLSAEMFVERVIELKKKSLIRRLASRIQEETAAELKTGTPPDLTGIRSDFDELDRLQNPAVIVKPLSAFEPKMIEWLWPGRIPKGMFSLLVGDPEARKSFCSISLAARLSRGEPLPDSQASVGCSTLFIVGEDPIREAVRPRADANGADVSKIFIFDEPGFHLADVPKIRRIIEDHKNIGLIVVDPLTGFFPPKTKYFEDPSVRAALLPLIGFAEESNVAVEGIAHLRKAEAEAAIHRVAGSIGLAAVARSILAVTRDEDDSDRRLLMSLKANYSKRPPSLAFRIGPDMRIVFEDAPIETDAEDALRSNEQRETINEKKFNVRWLLDSLRAGPKTIKELTDEAPFSRPTLFRLADKLEQSGKIERAPGTEGRFKVLRLRG